MCQCHLKSNISTSSLPYQILSISVTREYSQIIVLQEQSNDNVQSVMNLHILHIFHRTGTKDILDIDNLQPEHNTTIKRHQFTTKYQYIRITQNVTTLNCAAEKNFRDIMIIKMQTTTIITNGVLTHPVIL